MTAIYLRGHVREIDRANRKPGDPIWFVAATEGMKQDGLDLQMDRLDLDRFRANPVIGYGHRYFSRDDLPIGRADEIEVEAPELRLKVVFDQNDEFARLVEQKVVDGYLSAMSVGFDAWEVNPTTGVPAGWELFESSVVPIPLDPDALAEVGRAGIKEMEGMLARAREAFKPNPDPEPSPRDKTDGIAERVRQLATDLAEDHEITIEEAAARLKAELFAEEVTPETTDETPRAKRAERRMRLAGAGRA